MTAPGKTPDTALGPADAGFVAGLAALILPVSREPERERMLIAVLAELRPHLSAAPQIAGMAACFDGLTVLTPWSPDWRREFEDLRRRLVRFNEWRLGRAQEALKRR